MKVELWRSDTGRCPVGEFISQIGQTDSKAAGRILKDIDHLEEHGRELSKSDKVKKLKGHKNLYELRTFFNGMGYRIIFSIHKGTAWLLEAFSKKGKSTSKKYIENALIRRRSLQSA